MFGAPFSFPPFHSSSHHCLKYHCQYESGEENVSLGSMEGSP